MMLKVICFVLAAENSLIDFNSHFEQLSQSMAEISPRFAERVRRRSFSFSQSNVMNVESQSHSPGNEDMDEDLLQQTHTVENGNQSLDIGAEVKRFRLDLNEAQQQIFALNDRRKVENSEMEHLRHQISNLQTELDKKSEKIQELGSTLEENVSLANKRSNEIVQFYARLAEILRFFGVQENINEANGQQLIEFTKIAMESQAEELMKMRKILQDLSENLAVETSKCMELADENTNLHAESAGKQEEIVSLQNSLQVKFFAI